MIRPPLACLVSGWLALACSGLACAATAPLALTVEVRARALSAGEPVRIEVVSPEPLAALEGEFLGRSTFLFRTSETDGEERWSGWTMIALDEEPGITAVEIRGTTRSGREVVGTRALTIEAKQFPEEQLSVASRYVKPPREVEERLAREREHLAEIYRARRPVAPAEPFRRPVPGEPTSVFGTRRLYNGEPRSPHPGLDLRAATGDDVVAAGPGQVALARDLYYSGNTVILDHGGGLFTIYAHLSEIRVDEGDEAGPGQLLGLAGATGRVTGPHLHWGAKIGNRPFDPTALLEDTLF